MFQNETLSLTVKSGAVQGRQFNNLIEFMDEQEEFQERCRHSETRRSEVVSGLKSDKCHYNVALVCCRCNKVLDSVRQQITHSQGRRLKGEIARRKGHQPCRQRR